MLEILLYSFVSIKLAISLTLSFSFNNVVNGIQYLHMPMRNPKWSRIIGSIILHNFHISNPRSIKIYLSGLMIPPLWNYLLMKAYIDHSLKSELRSLIANTPKILGKHIMLQLTKWNIFSFFFTSFANDLQ